MASITKKTTGTGETRYQVRWRERQVLVGKGGARVEKWIWRKKTVRSMAAAKSLKSQVEFANDVGTRWVDEQREAVSELATVVDAYLDRGGNASTVRHKRSLLNKFLAWPGAPKTLDGMSSGVLLTYST